MKKNVTVEMEVSHLKKYYKAGWHSVLKAVDDVSFRIYKGETLAGRRIGMWKDDLWKDLHWNAG